MREMDHQMYIFLYRRRRVWPAVYSRPLACEPCTTGGEACAHIVTSEGVFLLACRSGRIRGLTLPDTV